MAAPYAQQHLANHLRADAFLPYGFGTPADRADRVQAAARRPLHLAVLAELVAQQAQLPPSTARAKNLDALRSPGTTVVITGQQVGFLLGPLYTLHKAATAVVVARQLEQETGRRCVPLFWLQTEDHDFAEVATAHSFHPDGPLRLTLPDVGPARVSVAHRLVPEVAPLLDALADSLSPFAHGEAVMDAVRAAYQPGRPLHQAFAQLLAGLFETSGLLVLSPRTATLAALAAPVLRRAITDRHAIDALLAERGQALAEAGHAEQVHLREGSPLAFFHLEGATGPRYRLPPSGEHAFALPTTPGATITEAELLAVLEREPLRFSTSALLRPLVQDTLLPTAAYVGGPAEVGYFAQLLPLYRHFGVEPPLVVPRARFRLVLPGTRRALEALGLSGAEAERPTDELLGQLARRATPEGLPSAAWAAELEARLAAFDATATDPALKKAVRRTRGTVGRALERFERKVQRHLADHDTVLRERVGRVQAALAPSGAPQERVLCFAAFAAAVGSSRLVELLVDSLDPLRPQVKELTL